MTEQAFLSFYPQFSAFPPPVVLREYLSQANTRFSDFDEPDREEARRLYVAHKLTLYSYTVPPAGEDSPARSLSAAGKGASARQVASRKVGEVSVAYGSGITDKVSVFLTDLSETAYGLQLLTLLRQYSRSRYIP